MHLTRIEIKNFNEFAERVDRVQIKINELNYELMQLRNYMRDAEVRLVDSFPGDESDSEK